MIYKFTELSPATSLWRHDVPPVKSSKIEKKLLEQEDILTDRAMNIEKFHDILLSNKNRLLQMTKSELARYNLENALIEDLHGQPEFFHVKMQIGNFRASLAKLAKEEEKLLLSIAKSGTPKKVKKFSLTIKRKRLMTKKLVMLCNKWAKKMAEIAPLVAVNPDLN